MSIFSFMVSRFPVLYKRVSTALKLYTQTLFSENSGHLNKFLIQLKLISTYCVRHRTGLITWTHSCLKPVARIYIYIYIYILSFVFLGLHLRHMEVPRLGVKLKLQLPARATDTSPCHRHSNVSSEPYLALTPQLRATLDP